MSLVSQENAPKKSILLLGDCYVGKTHLAYHLLSCDDGQRRNYIGNENGGGEDKLSAWLKPGYNIYKASGLFLQKIKKIPQRDDLAEFFEDDTEEELKEIEAKLNEKLDLSNLVILVVFDVDNQRSFKCAQQLLGSYSDITKSIFLIGNSGSGDVSKRVVFRDEIDKVMNGSVHYEEFCLRENGSVDRVGKFRNSHICRPKRISITSSSQSNGQTVVPRIIPVSPFVGKREISLSEESKLHTRYQEQQEQINSLRGQIADFKKKNQTLRENIMKNDVIIAGLNIEDYGRKDRCQ